VAGTDGRSVTLDPAVLARRYGERNATSKVFVPELFPILFPPERVAGQEAALDRAAASVAPSRDDRPVSFQHALARRQAIAGGLLAPLLGLASRASPAALGLLALLPSLLVLGVLILRRGSPGAASLAATHAVAVTGACGMGWSLLILYSFQARAGALYGGIGFLTALFMLGLAAGGLALARSADLPAERARRRLPAVIAAALLFALAMPGILRALGDPALARPGLQETAHALLLFAAGAVTGSLFPVAAGVLLSDLRGIVRTSGGLEAADHWGAAGAALLGGVVYVPALGLSTGARIPALLETAALLGALLSWMRRR
jgi:spermidine synthase